MGSTSTSRSLLETSSRSSTRKTAWYERARASRKVGRPRFDRNHVVGKSAEMIMINVVSPIKPFPPHLLTLLTELWRPRWLCRQMSRDDTIRYDIPQTYGAVDACTFVILVTTLVLLPCIVEGLDLSNRRVFNIYNT